MDEEGVANGVEREDRGAVKNESNNFVFMIATGKR